MIVALFPADHSNAGWRSKSLKYYTVFYTQADENHISEYNAYFETGLEQVLTFFNAASINHFEIYIHPSRQSLDSTWQQNWNEPQFKSECWMAASGVAHRLDMLSPAKWKDEACEHDAKDKLKTQQLITHELVHVFHGQHNKSPDFSNTEGIDWFVEGLAVYASGQCDSIRIAQVKNALANNETPVLLDRFWSGKYKYGLSGTMVMMIDKYYGRNMLSSLLSFSTKTEMLSALKTTEKEIMARWKMENGD